MKVLVTGGAGSIGCHVVDRLVDRGHEACVVDKLDVQVHGANASLPRHLERHLRTGTVRFIRGDVTDRVALGDSLDGMEAVTHLAAALASHLRVEFEVGLPELIDWCRGQRPEDGVETSLEQSQERELVR